MGISQLNKINKFLKKRKQVYDFYKKNLEQFSEINFIKFSENVRPSYHLFIIFIKNFKKYKKNKLINFFFKKKIILQHHYKPVYKFSFYKKRGELPNANRYFNSAISLPIHYNMSKKDLNYILKYLKIFFKL